MPKSITWEDTKTGKKVKAYWEVSKFEPKIKLRPVNKGKSYIVTFRDFLTIRFMEAQHDFKERL
jgi:NMD protein affecting ribosome stability and mRNA decay